MAVGLALWSLVGTPFALGMDLADAPRPKSQLIPILATAFDPNDQPIGVVGAVEVVVVDRNDKNGLDVRFNNRPGRFSVTTQVAVVASIRNIARVANLSTDSWSISLTVPYRGVTVYGTSLSAMVGLTVVALSQGDVIKPQRVLTGTIETDGHIGAVGGIALKLKAAKMEQLTRVLVPEDYDVTDGDWSTPFLLHVSPVSSVKSAYEGLTDHAFPGLGRGGARAEFASPGGAPAPQDLPSQWLVRGGASADSPSY